MKKIAVLSLSLILCSPTIVTSHQTTYSIKIGLSHYSSLLIATNALALIAFGIPSIDSFNQDVKNLYQPNSFMLFQPKAFDELCTYKAHHEGLLASIAYYLPIGWALSSWVSALQLYGEHPVTCTQEFHYSEALNERFYVCEVLDKYNATNPHSDDCIYDNKNTITMNHNPMTNFIIGSLAGTVAGCLSYLYARYPSTSIARIHTLERSTKEKYQNFIDFSYVLHPNYSKNSEAAIQDFFINIGREQIACDTPLVEAYHVYQLILRRMKRILEYVKKARSNSPNKLEEKTLALSEKSAKEIIEQTEVALLLIKEHPNYYQEMQSLHSRSQTKTLESMNRASWANVFVK